MDHQSADRVLEGALRGGMSTESPEGDPNSVLIGLALFDDDREYVERWCIRIGREAPDLWLRGLAALCVGTHVARRFGMVSKEAAQLVRDLAQDDAVRAVNSQVIDALDDLEFFAHGRP